MSWWFYFLDHICTHADAVVPKTKRELGFLTCLSSAFFFFLIVINLNDSVALITSAWARFKEHHLFINQPLPSAPPPSPLFTWWWPDSSLLDSFSFPQCLTLAPQWRFIRSLYHFSRCIYLCWIFPWSFWLAAYISITFLGLWWYFILSKAAKYSNINKNCDMSYKI